MQYFFYFTRVEKKSITSAARIVANTLHSQWSSRYVHIKHVCNSVREINSLRRRYFRAVRRKEEYGVNFSRILSNKFVLKSWIEVNPVKGKDAVIAFENNSGNETDIVENSDTDFIVPGAANQNRNPKRNIITSEVCSALDRVNVSSE